MSTEQVAFADWINDMFAKDTVSWPSHNCDDDVDGDYCALWWSPFELWLKRWSWFESLTRMWTTNFRWRKMVRTCMRRWTMASSSARWPCGWCTMESSYLGSWWLSWWWWWWRWTCTFCYNQIINLAAPDTIDERAINKGKEVQIFRQHENLTLARNSARWSIYLFGWMRVEGVGMEN